MTGGALARPGPLHHNDDTGQLRIGQAGHPLLHQGPARAGGGGDDPPPRGGTPVEHIDGARFRGRLDKEPTPLGELPGEPLGNFVLGGDRIAEKGLHPGRHRPPAYRLIPLDQDSLGHGSDRNLGRGFALGDLIDLDGEVGAEPAADPAGIAFLRVGKEGQQIALGGKAVPGDNNAAPGAEVGAETAALAEPFVDGNCSFWHPSLLLKQRRYYSTAPRRLTTLPAARAGGQLPGPARYAKM